MYASRLKPLAAVAVALSALLALGACGKKVDDASKPAAFKAFGDKGASPG